jgi:Zn-dependent peptidase ImmA (M78 family)
METAVANSFKAADSRLVNLFSERAEGAGADPRKCLKRLISELRRHVGSTEKNPQLEKAQAERKILQIDYKVHWDRDGALEPLGNLFEQGFKLSLNSRVPVTRMRFTQAHEVCHTFFYQYVPEIKFRPHREDAIEERLCNFGAAEFLMPEHSLRRRSSQVAESMESLLGLVATYGVSADAMMSRLRELRLWKSVLHVWCRDKTGQFVLNRVIGEKTLPWKWSDEKIPERAWMSPEYRGSTYLQYEPERGFRHFKSISFDARRQGGALLVLSGANVAAPAKRSGSRGRLF